MDRASAGCSGRRPRCIQSLAWLLTPLLLMMTMGGIQSSSRESVVARVPVDPVDALGLIAPDPFPDDRTASSGRLAPPIDAPPIDKGTDLVLQVSSGGELVNAIDQLGWRFADVVQASAGVPRLSVATLPDDLAALESSGVRKEVFLTALLPVVLMVNEAIEEERDRLIELQYRLRRGVPLAEADDAWLRDVARRYRGEPDDIATLLLRVDHVPPSMALAQGALESGWGTSLLARAGNALFGQITTDDDGIPSVSGDYRYAKFDSLRATVAAYAHNLNTHPAYAGFRALRARQRAEHGVLDGYSLLDGLMAYSERGEDYIRDVRRIIVINNLTRVDAAILATGDSIQTGSTGDDAVG